MKKSEDKHDACKVCRSMSRNLKVAVVELKQPLLEGGIIDVRDLLVAD